MTREPEPLASVPLSQIEPEPVTWLWPSRLPAGKLVLLGGDPGLGKSTCALDIAARITTEAPWPDGSGNAPLGDVVVLSAEDGAGDTIRPRLDAAGGDAGRVHIVTEPAGLPDDTDRLSDLICGPACGTRLVIVDPLAAYLSGSVDSHRDHSIRRALAPVAVLAQYTGACVLIIRHLNKGHGPALYRGGASIGITGAARMEFVVGADPEDDDRRVVACLKANLCRPPSSLSYSIQDAGGVGRVVWGGSSPLTAGQLLAGQDRGNQEEGSALDEAVEYLRGSLGDGPRPVREVMAEARRDGIADITLRRARSRLGVRTSPAGFGGPRLLHLPAQCRSVSISDAHSNGMRQTGKDERDWEHGDAWEPPT